MPGNFLFGCYYRFVVAYVKRSQPNINDCDKPVMSYVMYTCIADRVFGTVEPNQAYLQNW